MQRGKVSLGFVATIVAVVAATAVILFPTFVNTPCGSRKATCLNNLKQCAQALKMYTDDYNGKLPSSYLVSRSKGWNTPDYLTFGTTLGKFPPAASSRHTWAQVLYDDMRNNDIMFCPSDTVDKTDPAARVSYWYKLANDKAWYGIGCDAPRRSMKDYGYESDQIAFYERLGWHWGDTTGLHNGVQINASFMDTHVETITIKNATYGDPINCAANSNGEPMYYNCGTEPKHGYPKTQTGPATLTDPTRCYDNNL